MAALSKPEALASRQQWERSGGVVQAASFRCSKGDVADSHYKNLSGGEKAGFDILLDVFLKRDEAKEAVFCIGEPELHVATGLQRPLIASVLKLLR